MTDGIIPDAKLYTGFSDLARAQARGQDYEICVRRTRSPVAVIAPHGGKIEDGTSEIARAIADKDFNLYLFEGIRPSKNYAALHLTSTMFDEPECLALIAECQHVIAIHGCDGAGKRVLLGGRDVTLKHQIGAAIAATGLAVETADHRYPAVHRSNICNRGASRMGVQLEVTCELRRSADAVSLAATVRSVLGRLAIDPFPAAIEGGR